MFKLCAELNSRILKFAPKHTAKDNAPDTFESLKASSVSGLVVYAGASDNTIYGCPKVNHAFRAWHDSLHLSLNAPFTLEGELLIAKEQSRLLGSDIHGAIMLAEVKGQAEYFAKHGVFPDNQLKFMLDYLNIKLL